MSESLVEHPFTSYSSKQLFNKESLFPPNAGDRAASGYPRRCSASVLLAALCQCSRQHSLYSSLQPSPPVLSTMFA